MACLAPTSVLRNALPQMLVTSWLKLHAWVSAILLLFRLRLVCTACNSLQTTPPPWLHVVCEVGTVRNVVPTVKQGVYRQ